MPLGSLKLSWPEPATQKFTDTSQRVCLVWTSQSEVREAFEEAPEEEEEEAEDIEDVPQASI